MKSANAAAPEQFEWWIIGRIYRNNKRQPTKLEFLDMEYLNIQYFDTPAEAIAEAEKLGFKVM